MVVEMPTTGPNKGKVTRTFADDLHWDDAQKLKHALAATRQTRYATIVPDLEKVDDRELPADEPSPNHAGVDRCTNCGGRELRPWRGQIPTALAAETFEAHGEECATCGETFVALEEIQRVEGLARVRIVDAAAPTPPPPPVDDEFDDGDL